MIAFVQARMGSSRLPGKSLTRLPNGMVLVEHVMHVLMQQRVDARLVTSEASQDDALAALAAQKGWPCYRGSQHNVLQRFVDAARHFALEDSVHVLRVCADNPMLSPYVVRCTMQAVAEDPSIDYFSLGLRNTPGILLHAGIFVEAVKVGALRRVLQNATLLEKEHVTAGLYTHPETYRVVIKDIPRSWQPGFDNVRLTIDDATDLQFVRDIFLHICHQDFDTYRSFLLSKKEWVLHMSSQIVKHSK
jgi:spore coat polysaccharide biosynthesis protein SpsF (cytidylyltransferase family)